VGDDVAEDDLVSLRQVAELLDLKPIRLYRLGRHFRLAPGDPCIPRSVIARGQAEPDQERRYRLILDWVRTQGREPGPPSPSGSPTGS
jgi:hypothetical protein